MGKDQTNKKQVKDVQTFLVCILHVISLFVCLFVCLFVLFVCCWVTFDFDVSLPTIFFSKLPYG